MAIVASARNPNLPVSAYCPGRGRIVELILSDLRRLNGHAVSIDTADIESIVTGCRDLVGRHAVVLQATAIEELELGGYLPCVGSIEGQLVFRALGVLRAELVEVISLRARRSVGKGIIVVAIENGGILIGTGIPLER